MRLLYDLNGDGKKDIVGSNHDVQGKGGVFAWQVPDKKAVFGCPSFSEDCRFAKAL